MTIDEYLNLITSQHRDKPKFVATVQAMAVNYVYLQDLLRSLHSYFDIDTALGNQLDIIGEWVGVGRNVNIPIDGVYFSWNDTASTGWNNGVWNGANDPTSGVTMLPDDSYRLLLKAKIAANSWDGTIPSMMELWETVFPGSHLLIQDNQNMTMSIGISGIPMSSLDKALLTQGYIPLKPSGVGVEYYRVLQNQGKFFAWNVEESDAMAGWGAGEWPEELANN
jgi:hypothetical protein